MLPWCKEPCFVAEVRCSPTKPSGKGNKRKQEDVDEEEHQSWVEALNQELRDEDSEGDPTYEVRVRDVTERVWCPFWTSHVGSICDQSEEASEEDLHVCLRPFNSICKKLNIKYDID